MYKGYNIHNYTKEIITIIPKYFGKNVYKKVTILEWKNVLSDICKKIPRCRALQNMNKNFKNGFIIDPELPKINSAMILILIWDKVKNNNILCKHFTETLKDIGNTCIQGISHRLIIDYIAIYNDILYQYISSIFGIIITNQIINYL